LGSTHRGEPCSAIPSKEVVIVFIALEKKTTTKDIYRNHLTSILNNKSKDNHDFFILIEPVNCGFDVYIKLLQQRTKPNNHVFCWTQNK